MAWALLQWGSEVSDIVASLAGDLKAETRVKRDLRRLAAEGSRLRFPHTDSLGDGLFELRTPLRGMIYRHIFMFHENNCIVILVSFEKKTQKTPLRYIDLAKARRIEIYQQEAKLGRVAVH